MSVTVLSVDHLHECILFFQVHLISIAASALALISVGTPTYIIVYFS
jgi:hypothetical protein